VQLRDKPYLTFDTEAVSGYDRITGFVKVDSEIVECEKSHPIFANPINLSKDNCSLCFEKPVTLQLNGDIWTFPALYFPQDSQWLFVMMPSAIDRNKTVLPAFHRWTWVLEGLFPGNALCIADPTLELNEDLRVGWLIGNREKCATRELAELVGNLATSKRIPNEKIVIYGSSAGGFAALALAAYIEGATAVAINAQTDVLSYYPQKPVSLIRKYCFGNLSKKEIRRDFSDRVDMSQLWRCVSKSRALLVQNETDTHHYNVHFMPFWKSLGGTSDLGICHAGHHTAWVYHQEGGHIPESKEMAREIISMLKL
jgi:hypothetical protein